MNAAEAAASLSEAGARVGLPSLGMGKSWAFEGWSLGEGEESQWRRDAVEPAPDVDTV